MQRFDVAVVVSAHVDAGRISKYLQNLLSITGWPGLFVVIATRLLAPVPPPACSTYRFHAVASNLSLAALNTGQRHLPSLLATPLRPCGIRRWILHSRQAICTGRLPVSKPAPRVATRGSHLRANIPVRPTSGVCSVCAGQRTNVRGRRCELSTMGAPCGSPAKRNLKRNPGFHARMLYARTHGNRHPSHSRRASYSGLVPREKPNRLYSVCFGLANPSSRSDARKPSTRPASTAYAQLTAWRARIPHGKAMDWGGIHLAVCPAD